MPRAVQQIAQARVEESQVHRHQTRQGYGSKQAPKPIPPRVSGSPLKRPPVRALEIESLRLASGIGPLNFQRNCRRTLTFHARTQPFLRICSSPSLQRNGCGVPFAWYSMTHVASPGSQGVARVNAVCLSYTRNAASHQHHRSLSQGPSPAATRACVLNFALLLVFCIQMNTLF